jgi:hypothetical protein
MTPERKHAVIAELQRRFGELMSERLDAIGDRSLTVDEIEELVEDVGREVDSRLEERLIEEQSPPAENCATCPCCGERARYKETRHTRLLTTHGCRAVPRRYYYCQRCRDGFSPMDAILELDQGRNATRRVRSWMAKYGAQEESFAGVPPILMELRGLVVSESTVERTTIEVGAALAAANREAARSAEVAAADGAEDGTVPAPERLYLSMDGTMAPLREVWKKDGSLGKLTTRYGEAKVGMAFTTDRKEGLDTEVTSRGCVATLGSVVFFTLLMLWLARRWGADRAKELVVLGDGAAWIWKLVRRHFPRAVQILDLWHVIEHLWTIAEARFGGRENDAARIWVRAARSLLEEDHVDAVIGDIGDWKPRLVKHRKLRDREVAFLRRNRHRLLYGTFLKEGLMVGSGVIESRCKQVVQRRLHEAGMHWREHTAEAVLAIRAFLHETGPRDLRVYA